jgi:hypothetical protein
VPVLEYVRPYVTPYQELGIFGPHRVGVIEATTKAGKTVGCVVWLHEEAIQGRPGDNYWWVAPVYGQARIAFERMRRYLNVDRLAEVCLACEVQGGHQEGCVLCRWERVKSSPYRSTESPMVIRCPNGALIQFKSAEKPDNLYGDDVRAVVLDEASRMREAAWWAIRSVLTATRGRLRVIGNVKGRRNFHYMLARRAEAGEDGMFYAKWTAWTAVEAGILAREEVEAAQRDLPEDVFNELYLAIPSDDGGNPFGLAHIDAARGPRSDRAPFVWGWDLAKSIDYTVGIALDDTGAWCRFERWKGVPWETTVERIRRHTEGCYALVDSTGVGDPILEQLRQSYRITRTVPQGYYLDGTPYGSRTDDVIIGSNFHGYKFTPSTKQQLMEGLALVMQRTHHELPGRRAIVLPDNKVMLAELDVFEFQHTRTGVRYSAPEGYHDDTVVSLALAAAAYRSRMTGRIPNLPPLHLAS